MQSRAALPEAAMRTFDATQPAQATALAGRLRRLHGDALLALLLGLGERLGLFAALAQLPLSSSHAIAAHAGLDERYVREWLAAMVCAGIVDYDGALDAYGLSPAHAAVLNDAPQARRARSFALYAALAPEVERCFAEGGGVARDACKALLALRAQDAAGLLPDVLPLWPELQNALQRGIDVLDLGGSLAGELARAFPRSRLSAASGGDLDAAEPARFDCAVGLFQLGLDPAPGRMLAAVRRALRPHGVLLCIEHAASSQLADDAAHPHAAHAYAESVLLALPLTGNGEALGWMSGEARARRLLRESGFSAVELRPVPGDREHHVLLGRVPAARSS
jgi:hypothetical protein